MKVSQYMTALPQTVGVDASLEKALELMALHKCRHLPVLKGGHLLGVVSERDISQWGSLQKPPQNVGDVMAFEPLVVSPATPLREVAEAMLKEGVGSAIVAAEQGTNWGIFTVTDALRALIELLPRK